MRLTRRAATSRTGGRSATTRVIPPKLALAVGMPSIPAPPGWKWSALTDLARMESGHTPSRRHPEYWGGKIPWVSIQDARDHHGGRISQTRESTNQLGIDNSSARVLPKNTVCLSRTASVGYVVVMDRPMATSQDFVNWVCSDALEPDFLKYLFIAEGNDLLRFASGAVHQTIYFPEAKAFHICHPDVGEQKRLIALLDRAFIALDAARTNTEQNVERTQHLLELYHDTILTTKRENWIERHLVDAVATISTGPFGSMLHKSDYVNKGVAVVNPIDIVGGRVALDGCKTVSHETAARLQRYALAAGDVVVGRRGEIGRCAVIESDVVGSLCGTGCFYLTPNRMLSPHLLAHILRARSYRVRLESASTGATMKNLSNAALKRLLVAFPPSASIVSRK